MNNIFIVKSPLQLLNALEAKYHFDLPDESCVLIIMADRKSYSQMIELAKEQGHWGSIRRLDYCSPFSGKYISGVDALELRNNIVSRLFSSSIFTVSKLNRIADSFGRINYLFVGDNHNPYMRHFINKCSYEKVVLLDDGVGAIYMAEIRSMRHQTTPNIAFRKKLKLMAKRYIQGLDDRQADSLCFFSAYDLSVPPGDSVIKNEYKYLEKISKNNDVIECVYFLGAPLDETGVMTRAEYIDSVRKSIEYFGDKKFVYVAHRREDAEKLQHLENTLHVEVTKFQFPIEYQIAKIGPKPEIVASFISSALENLRLIMGDEIKIVAFRLKEGTYGIENRIDAIYAYYEENLSDNFVLEYLQ